MKNMIEYYYNIRIDELYNKKDYYFFDTSGNYYIFKPYSNSLDRSNDIYNINMEETQKSKLLDEIPELDIVITMGCNVECPYLPCKFREDWGLDDPTGKSDDEIIKVMKTIENKILDLKNRIENKEMTF